MEASAVGLQATALPGTQGLCRFTAQHSMVHGMLVSRRADAFDTPARRAYEVLLRRLLGWRSRPAVALLMFYNWFLAKRPDASCPEVGRMGGRAGGGRADGQAGGRPAAASS